MARIIISSLIVGALIAGGWFLRTSLWSKPGLPSEPPETGSSGATDCGHSINALGYLQPADGILSVSAQPGDQLAVLHVKEGDSVSAGKLIAELQSKDLRYLEWKARESQRTEAEKQFAAEQLAAEKKVEAAKLAIEKIGLQTIEETAQKAQIDFLTSNLQLVTKNLERLRDVRDDLVSKQQIEQQQMLVEKTTAELKAAESTLERMQASRGFAEKSAAAELEIAKAGLKQVEAMDQTESLEYAEKIAKLQYEHTLIEAPADGVVLQTFMQPGESVTAQPILQMGNLDRMICQAEVFQTDIQCIHEGQSARVTSPAFPESSSGQGIAGKVRRISRLVASPKLQSLDPYAAADRHVVEVEIELDAEASRVAAMFVNLQVQVVFQSDSAE